MLNELAVPLGRATRVTLRSTDVIHSFFVRELRVKQDAVPGMSCMRPRAPTQLRAFGFISLSAIA